MCNGIKSKINANLAPVTQFHACGAKKSATVAGIARHVRQADSHFAIKKSINTAKAPCF